MTLKGHQVKLAETEKRRLIGEARMNVKTVYTKLQNAFTKWMKRVSTRRKEEKGDKQMQCEGEQWGVGCTFERKKVSERRTM